MTIEKILGGFVTVSLDPGQCLAIAEACDIAGNHEAEEDRAAREAYFDLLQGMFEALALVASAKCRMDGPSGAGFDLATTRRTYTAIPAAD